MSKELIKLMDQVMEMLLNDIETDNDSPEFFLREEYREIYRKYLNIKDDIKKKPKDNIQQGIWS